MGLSFRLEYLIGLLAAFAITLHLSSVTEDFTAAAWSLILAVLCVGLVWHSWGKALLAAPALYLCLLLLFHFGVVWTLGFVGEKAVLGMSENADTWVRTPQFHEATSVAAIATLVVTTVAVVLRPRRSDSAGIETGAGRGAVAPALAWLGNMMQLGGLAVLIQTLLASGVGLSSGSYLSFLESTGSTTVTLGLWGLGFGVGLSQLGSHTAGRIGLILFAFYGGIFYLIGLRGWVLFPLVVALAARHFCGKRVNKWFLGVGVIVVLIASSLVRSRRIGESSDGSGPLGSAMRTVTELGFSIRPLVEVLRWQEQGEPHSTYVTFFAVPIRLLESILGIASPDPDPRLFNVKMQALVGSIGGSPVAEAYDAGSYLGVVVVMAAIAALICWTARARVTPLSAGLMVVVLFPLAVGVRNSFAPIPVQWGLGVVLVVATQVVSGRLEEARARRRGRTRVVHPHGQAWMARGAGERGSGVSAK